MTENITTPAVDPDVLTADQIIELVPRLQGHKKLVERLMRWIKLDEINRIHAQCCSEPGYKCAESLLRDAFNIKLEIDGREYLDHLPDGAFITVSNHPFGALDGITLIALVASRRPEFQVMVNMILNRIGGLRPNFIAVDPMAQNDPAKRAVSIKGIRRCISQLREGHPIGFFPAGAMSKTDIHGRLQDRPWQDSVLQIIYKADVPVIPIFFHGSNSFMFNVMGHVCWPMRSLMLPREVVRKTDSTIHVSVGKPISPEEQRPYRDSFRTLGDFLRERTYVLRDQYGK